MFSTPVNFGTLPSGTKTFLWAVCFFGARSTAATHISLGLVVVGVTSIYLLQGHPGGPYPGSRDPPIPHVIILVTAPESWCSHPTPMQKLVCFLLTCGLLASSQTPSPGGQWALPLLLEPVYIQCLCKYLEIHWKVNPSLCSQRLGNQPAVLTCFQGWYWCGAARLGWESGFLLFSPWVQVSHYYLVGAGVLAGRVELRSPASFTNVAVCRSGVGGMLDSGSAPRASWFCLSSALTQKRFSSGPGGLTIRLGLSHLGTWLGSAQGPGESHCGCSLGSGLAGPPSGS